MSYTIANTFTLPSLGKVYAKEINPEIKLRSWTTEEEMRRLNHSDRPMKVIAELIDECTIGEKQMSAYDMCVSDYQFLLHRLRMVSLGPEYQMSTMCPMCGSIVKSQFNLDTLKVREYTPELMDELSFTLPVSEQSVVLRPQTPRDIEDISLEVKRFQETHPEFEGSWEYLLNVIYNIVSIDGDTTKGYKSIIEWGRKLPIRDANYIIQKQNNFVKNLGIDPAIAIVCKNSKCGLAYKGSFLLTDEFFRPGI